MKIAISSIKGGVGKTTLAALLAQVAAEAGKRVLIIDSDSNNNLTDYYLRNKTFEEIDAANLYHVFMGSLPIKSAIYKTENNIDILPCTLNLSRISLEMAGRPAGMLKFSKLLDTLDYDIIIIDSPPFLGYELRNAIYAADIILTPVSLTRWTLQALMLLQEEVEEIAQIRTPPYIYAVPCIVTESENEKIRTIDGFNFSKSYIKKMAGIKNAVDYGKPLKSGSPAFSYFENLYQEAIK